MHTENSSYQGPERRRGPRRTLADRRQEMRVDLYHEDRRAGPGRRKTDTRLP